MAYADDELDITAIFTEPPDVSVLTDEDSGDEEDLGDLDRLPGRQLRAPVEILQRNNNRIHSDSIKQSTSLDLGNSEPQRKEKQATFLWTNGDLEARGTEFFPPDFLDFADCTPVDVFEMFWDKNIFEYLVDETRKYASFKNAADPKITLEEVKCALAILVLSGYNVKLARRYHWDSKCDIGNDMVKNAMRKNRFETIMQFLHLADNNNPDTADKAWKIRPLMDMLKERFLQYFVPEEHINYDESMVKYFGRHSCKQFIRGKPIRFGYKMWCLNTKGGYLINFDLYQGKNPRSCENDEVLYGKATSPMVTMLKEIPEINEENAI